MDTWYVELQEETLRSVPSEMVTGNHVLVVVASEEQGHLREIGHAQNHDADGTFLVPWTTEYDETCDLDSDDHGRYAELCVTA
eukprot:8028946-Pyramimonas_sp.AAC.1